MQRRRRSLVRSTEGEVATVLNVWLGTVCHCDVEAVSDRRVRPVSLLRCVIRDCVTRWQEARQHIAVLCLNPYLLSRSGGT